MKFIMVAAVLARLVRADNDQANKTVKDADLQVRNWT